MTQFFIYGNNNKNQFYSNRSIDRLARQYIRRPA